jgi:hypothetical protein
VLEKQPGLIGIECASVLVFVTDLVVVGCICAKLIAHALRDTARDINPNSP